MKCDGKRSPTSWQSALARWRYRLRMKLSHRLRVGDGALKLRFICNSELEEYRARTLYTKEEGTIKWIREHVKPGDAFLDIGANIGLYSMVAAQCVGPTGAVYAVEPHLVNFQSLLRNIAENNFQDRVRAFSCALHEKSTLLEFNYYSLDPGSSMSQLGSSRDAEEQDFTPVACEHKQAVAVDDLIASGAMRPPNHVKIDVDGNELLVLQGMRKLLTGSTAPKTLQVEINRRYKVALFDFFSELGFELAESHYTLAGKTMIAAGKNPDDVAHNAVFRPSRVHACRRTAA
jgi:FkbM family methyltransferase